MIKILIACGSGIATSAYAEAAVVKICRSIDVEVRTFKSTITDAFQAAEQVDLVVFTSNNWKKYYDAATFPKPALSVAPLITGVGEEDCKANLVAMIKEIDK